jgi:hypothetical protein
LISCNSHSRLNNREKQSLEKYFWGNNEMSLDSIKDYKLNIVLKNISANSLNESSKTNDTAMVLGENNLFFSATKQNNFYTDGKYFFFFYPEKTSMYGESKKDRTLRYYSNVIQVLRYCMHNLISYSVDSAKAFNTIIINLPENNDLNCNTINIKVSNTNETFRIKNIDYVVNIERNNQMQTSQSSIDILNYCFNTGKCHDTLNLSQNNFYTESNGEVLLKGPYATYKLEKFFQW